MSTGNWFWITLNIIFVCLTAIKIAEIIKEKD